MRRKTDKDIRKEYVIFLILGCLCILLAILFILSPLIPSRPYEDYVEKEVVIRKLDRPSSRYRGITYHIVTEDGDSYSVTGEFNSTELNNTLVKGTTATIRYAKNRMLPFILYAEEVVVDGELIVTYDNDQPINWTLPIIACALALLPGGCLLAGYRWGIVRNRRMQAKRDARITKKYGKHQE